MSEHRSSTPGPTDHGRRPWWPVAAVVIVIALVVAAVATWLGQNTTSRESAPPATTASSSSGAAAVSSTATGATPGARATGSGATTASAGASGTGAASAGAAGTGAGASTRASGGASSSARASAPATAAGELPAAAPTAVVSAADGLQLSIARRESVTGESVLAGEIAGPAVRLTIQATNRGSEPVNLDLFVVNAYVGPALTPAGNVTQPGGRPFTGTLAPGADATGVYLFSIPTDQRGRVRVTVDYRAQAPRVVFEGSLAG